MNLKSRRPIITASEIGEFVYCAKAWELKRRGAQAQGPQLAIGTAFHEQHAAGITRGNRLQRAGRILLLLALLLLSALLWQWLSSAPK